MKSFLFKMPTRIIFGEGAVSQAGSLCAGLGGQRVYIVSGPHVSQLPAAQKLKDSLDAAGIQWALYANTITDPTVEAVDTLAGIAREFSPDILIALGGGSPTDTAKALSVLLTNKGSIRDYLFGGSRSVTNPAIPLICIPTTAGSGSEVTASAVISDEENHTKRSITTDEILPKIALIDPEVQTGLSPFTTATSGMDALTHAIESYTSLNAEPISDAFSLQAIRLIGRYLRRAAANGSDMEARSNMAIASSIASAAFMNGGLGVVHGIAQAMGAIAHTAHGLSNAVILPYAMERNLVGNLEKFRDIAEALGEPTAGLSLREAAYRSVTAVRQLCRDLNIPERMHEIGVTEAMLPDIVKETMAYRLLAINPVRLSQKDVEAIIAKAF